MHIKICGLTRPDDAELAVALGASALGFVFWPGSPRAVGADVVRGITRALPPFVAAVGVFVNAPRDEVLRTAARAALTAVQLHGEEDPAEYAEEGLRVIKAVPVGPRFAVEAVEALPPGVTVLLDAHDPIRRGGTGRTIDWTAAGEAARRRPVILSGGLTAGNVGRAVQLVRPYAVDVSSGVESAPGVKDREKLRDFFAAAVAPRMDGT